MNLCVIGKPLKHSFSPIIHNYWLRKYSKPCIYEKKEIESSFLPDIISQMKNKKLIGVNVTIPYKRNVYNLLKNLDINAKNCLLYTSPSPRDSRKSRMPSSA